jgi:hypothetical protein
MKLQEKIDFVSTWLECKKDMVNNTLILCQIHIFYLMNSENFMNTIKNLSNMTAKRTYGL